MSEMLQINVRMKRGGMMPMDVRASVHEDSDGSGWHGTVCEDLEIFWLGRGSRGKRYPVSEKLIANPDEVLEDYCNALGRG